ncbi:MAG: DUF2092 domain-containing protein [Phycisphaerae bacterium]|nr:DUF2092 domain-containing protein [Phycisphaerae bacterium]
MSPNEFKTDDDFQSAFAEAVECFTPPAGLKEQIEKRLADGRDCETQATPSSPKSIRRQATADRQNQISYLLERIRHMKRWKKTLITAAAAALVIAAIGVWMHMPRGSVPGLTGITFADVQRQMRNAETMSCVINAPGTFTETNIHIEKTEDEKGNVIEDKTKRTEKTETKTGETKIKLYLKEPNLLRLEMYGPSDVPVAGEGIYVISDSRSGKAIILMPGEKTYKKENSMFSVAGMIMASYKQGFNETKKMIENGEAKLIGEKTIDGRKAKGYAIEEDDMKGEIWADAETAMPIQVTGADPKNTGHKMTISNIRINEPLDDSLFSMEIPEGYREDDSNSFEITFPEK